MSKAETQRAIRAEIERLNQAIDWKIIKGISYEREARRHKMLIRELKRFSGKSAWFAKSLQFVSMFMF